MTAVFEKIQECPCSIDLLGFTPEGIASIVRFILNNNYFMFGYLVFHQTKGVAMANHIAPPLAIVFMDRLEKRMLVTAEMKLECYGRNMDNIISICVHAWSTRVYRTHGPKEFEFEFREFVRSVSEISNECSNFRSFVSPLVNFGVS